MIEQLEVGDIILLKKEYWDNPEQPITGVVIRLRGTKSDPNVIFKEDGVESLTYKEEIQAIYKLRCTLDYKVIKDEQDYGDSIYTEDEFFHPND
jgi:hypothetical protein